MTLAAEIRQFLQELGLNSVEIATYLAALEIGSGPASAIASVAGLNRITAYEALKRLSKKGFIKIRAKRSDRVRYFVPEDITVLQEKLEEKKKAVEAAIARSRTLKDELRARFRAEEKKPVVLFYEGEEGVREVLNDTLKQNPDEIVSF
jgi:sugar-specific transcriptional regulator TrmB